MSFEFLDEEVHVLEGYADSHQAEDPAIEEALGDDVELMLSK